MANVAQMAVDVFYTQLAQVRAAGDAEITALARQKLDLQHAYTNARNGKDSAAMQHLTPLIHSNSALRVRAREYMAKFNALVAQASSGLKSAGFAVPSPVTGLGFVQFIVPIAWVLALGVVWAIVHELQSGREAIDNAFTSEGPQLLAVANDATATPADRAAALATYNKLLDAAKKGAGSNPLTDATPIIMAVAAIMLLPSLLQALPKRRAAA